MSPATQASPEATLAGRLAAEIRETGPMRFDRFMARALYDPEGGYYGRHTDQIGRAGDFFTSVSVGSLYGELLGFVFAGLLAKLPTDAREVWIMEAGAHDGRLAADILGWLREWRPRLNERVTCGIVEPSPSRQAVQRRRLASFEGKVRWFGSLSELAALQPRGVLYSNELLDALPLRRFVWRHDANAGRWREAAVAVADDGESLGWTEVDVPSGEWESERWLSMGRERVRELEPVLPTGFVWEHPAGAIDWWAAAARTLAEGWLVAIDHGHAGVAPLAPERPDGTLRAFREHHQVADALANPGEQDLTADVPFDWVRRVGEAAGLATVEFRSQGAWLTDIVASVEAGRQGEGFPAWTPSRRRQVMTLVHPEHLGGRFRVLLQHRPGVPLVSPNPRGRRRQSAPGFSLLEAGNVRTDVRWSAPGQPRGLSNTEPS